MNEMKFVSAFGQEPEGDQALPQPAGSRVKLVIPGQEPMLIDTLAAGDVVLVLSADGQGVQVKSDAVDITLRRGTQPGSIAMSSPMGGTFEMQGQFAWMKDNRNVLLATVGGSSDPLSSPSAANSEPSATPATSPAASLLSASAASFAKVRCGGYMFPQYPSG